MKLVRALCCIFLSSFLALTVHKTPQLFTAYCASWTGLEWTGLVKRGLVKRGLVKRGIVDVTKL